MKKTLIILVLLLFGFPPNVYAELTTKNIHCSGDIFDFGIEDMHIGNSLLDYFSEEEIKKNVIDLSTVDRNDSFADKIYIVDFYINSFKFYKRVSIFLKIDDQRYTIYGIEGIQTIKDIFDCEGKQQEFMSNLPGVAFQSFGPKTHGYRGDFNFIRIN